MKKKSLALFVLGLSLVATAWAAQGFRYVADTVTSGTNMKQEDRVRVEGWFEGSNAKMEFREVGQANPFLEEGKYLLTNDGGETFYLVDPKENTHAEFDVSEILAFAGEIMDSGMINMEVANHSIELLEERDGPNMYGYDTQYRKFRTSYDLQMKIMGMKRADHFVLESEIWSAEGIDAAGFQAWMRPRETGFEAVDTLMKGELEKVNGLPFKTITTTRSQGAKKKGRTSETTSTTEVTEFESMNVANSIFKLPEDSREIQLIPLGEGAGAVADGDEAEPEEEGGLFKRFKKLRKGDG